MDLQYFNSLAENDIIEVLRNSVTVSDVTGVTHIPSQATQSEIAQDFATMMFYRRQNQCWGYEERKEKLHPPGLTVLLVLRAVIVDRIIIITLNKIFKNSVPPALQKLKLNMLLYTVRFHFLFLGYCIAYSFFDRVSSVKHLSKRMELVVLVGAPLYFTEINWFET